MLSELFVEWLIGGTRRPQRAELLLFLGLAVFGSLLSLVQVFQNRSAKLGLWPEYSFYGMMFGVLVATPALPIGVVHFIRYRTDRTISAACALISAAVLAGLFWVLNR